MTLGRISPRQVSTIYPNGQGQRFFLLDGLRGVAALAVMVFHIFPRLPGGLIGHGYLAVDFFFLLSGFVIALNYEKKLQADMTLWRFIALRVIRLYPLSVAAVLSVALLTIAYPKPHLPDERFMYNLVMNLLLLPNTLTVSAEKFPFLLPSWSLFCEIIVNIAYAIALPALRGHTLKVITIASAIGLCYLTFCEGTVQILYHNLAYGFIRTIFSFSLGVLIFRSVNIIHILPKLSRLTIYVTLIIIVTLPIGIISNVIYDLAAIIFIFPILLWSSISYQGSKSSPIENELGELSYPIYLLHMPAAAYTGIALGWAVGGNLLNVCALCITIVTAALAWRFYDRPVRSWLSRRFLARPNRTTLPART